MVSSSPLTFIILLSTLCLVSLSFRIPPAKVHTLGKDPCEKALGKEMWITQPVAHSNFKVNSSWKQRYFVDTSYWNKSSSAPILFNVGNEGSVCSKITYMQTGRLRKLAEDYGSVIVYAEHRYYGESLPFGNASLQPENLGYLTMANAMSDYVAIVLEVRKTMKLDGPLVAFGCSYGGILTALFKMRYPQYVYAAHASASPLLFYNPDSSWGDHVVKTVETDQPECYSELQREVQRFLNLSSAGNFEAIQDELKLCKTPANSTEAGMAFFWFIQSLGLAVQFNYPYPEFFDISWALNDTCSPALDAVTMESMPVMLRSMSNWFNMSGELDCFDISATFNISAGTGIGQAWAYQTCTEITLAIGGGVALFGPYGEVPDDYWSQLNEQCEQMYGVTTQREQTTMTYPMTYGNLSAAAPERLLLVNGGYDPTSSLSPQYSVSASMTVLNVSKASHCYDMNTPMKGVDTPEVEQARKVEDDLFKEWISSYSRS